MINLLNWAIALCCGNPSCCDAGCCDDPCCK